MVYPYQVVAIFGLSFLFGVLIASYFHLPIWIILLGIFLFGITLFLKRRVLIRLISVFGLGMLLGWWRYDAVIQPVQNSVADWAGETITVSGFVKSDPETINNVQTLHLDVYSIEKKPAAGKILLSTWPLPRFYYGDELTMKAKISLPKLTPEFDYAAYLRKDGIYALGQTVSEVSILRSPRNSVLYWLYKAKHWLSGQINKFLPEPDSALMNGLLLGLRTQLPEQFKELLQYSGTTHIIALSGFNITVIAGFFLWMFGAIPRRFGLIMAGLGILLFVLMTGAASSVVRAAIMGGIMLLAAYLHRRRSLFNAVIVAAMIMVAINPLVLQYDAGFQLSVAATIGLIAITPLVLPKLSGFPIVVKEALATTAAATVAVIPLVVFHFGGFSLYTILANLLVVPLVPITMLTGFATLVIHLAVPFWGFIGLASFALTRVLVNIISFFGSLPYAFVELPPLSPVWPVIYYLLLIVGVYWLKNVQSKT
ncbi:hypothetical protein DRH29_01075 [candidate division Kazan bacterium]|uniref:ComEC family competence protein n=1 Tax=candidate division Kazan bacterium TaxID=2202143 RepID=A0A420ZDI6_UNCK3|nr:MAG: hypothetical protein DRH29_01075 [candidate division Kazan bacterium]